MVVRSTPLTRYSAWRNGSSPRLFDAFAFFAFVGGGASRRPLGRRHVHELPLDFLVVRREPAVIASYIFTPCCRLKRWSARQWPVNWSAISASLF